MTLKTQFAINYYFPNCVHGQQMRSVLPLTGNSSPKNTLKGSSAELVDMGVSSFRWETLCWNPGWRQWASLYCPSPSFFILASYHHGFGWWSRAPSFSFMPLGPMSMQFGGPSSAPWSWGSRNTPGSGPLGVAGHSSHCCVYCDSVALGVSSDMGASWRMVSGLWWVRDSFLQATFGSRFHHIGADALMSGVWVALAHCCTLAIMYPGEVTASLTKVTRGTSIVGGDRLDCKFSNLPVLGVNVFFLLLDSWIFLVTSCSPVLTLLALSS